MQIPSKKDANTQHEPVKSQIQLLTSKKGIEKCRSPTSDNFMRKLVNKGLLQGVQDQIFQNQFALALHMNISFNKMVKPKCVSCPNI